MMVFATIIFWICAAGLFYTYLGYPLHVLLWSRLFPRPVKRGPFSGSVTVMISVFNDAARLAPKLAGLFQVRGAEKIREVLVGSDASTDGIAAELAKLNEPRIRLVEFAQRRGKAAVLNDLMPLASGDVVVMTDARQPLVHDALEILLESFADPTVGVVSGHLVFRQADNSGAATRGVGSYWSYEKTIRRAEAAFASVAGATGALYAIRRALLRPIPATTILDDVAIPMLAIAQGARCIFENDAVCYDDRAASVATEQIRKRRTIAGNLQLVQFFPHWLLPWRNPAWWPFLCHKLLRLLSPFFLIAAFASSAALALGPTGAPHRLFFAAAFALQSLAYLLALAGWACDRAGVKTRLLSLPFVFAALNVTTLLAWCDALRGRYNPAWQKT